MSQPNRSQSGQGQSDPSQSDQSESPATTTNNRQSKSSDASPQTTNDPLSDFITPSRATITRPPSSTHFNPTISTPGSKETDASSSMAVTTSTLTWTQSVPVTPTSTSSAEATTPGTAAADGKAFKMTPVSISVTIVLACFVLGGLAIMLYFRFRGKRGSRGRHRWSALAPKKDNGSRPKSAGDSLITGSMSARESRMYHPDDRRSTSAASAGEGLVSANIRQWEAPPDYRVEDPENIMMSEIEAKDDDGRSSVSPLVTPYFPRPVSNISRASERPSLRREFSFEITQEPSQAPSRESLLDRRSALMSHPPTDWPIATPSNYGYVFPPQQPSQSYQSASAMYRSSDRWYPAGQMEGFEDVPTRGG